MSDLPAVTPRLVALLDHLGIGTAHIATQMPGDIAGLAAAHPERLSGIVLPVPARLDAAPFAGLGPRMLMIAGDGGITAEATRRGLEQLPGATRHLLAGYDAPGWADVAADRTRELVDLVTGFLAAAYLPPTSGPRPGVPRTGEHAGITWRIEGSGPPLVLLPFFLAPSQWTPAVALLRERFTVIRLGGAHVGGVGALEDRARSASYRALFNTLVDLLDIRDGDRVLDVGCGSGALDRLLAGRLGAAAHIDAVDINDYLLDEARQLAEAAGVGTRIRFGRGSAEAIPFPDASFDRVFSITVLEECDADRALAELWRVLKPGGRAAVIVRAIDLRQWWNLELPVDLRERASTPAQSVGRGGVADQSLYARVHRAGFRELQPFPSLVALDQPEGPIWRYREDHVLGQLGAAEREVWQTARKAAQAAGVLFQAHPMHAVAAVKPA